LLGGRKAYHRAYIVGCLSPCCGAALMARIRTVKPEFWSDRRMAELPYRTRLFYMALWNFVDDHGRGRAIPKELAGFAFPHDDDVGGREVTEMLGELAAAGRVQLYKVDDDAYLWIPRFNEHQVINNPAKLSRFPDPPALETVGLREDYGSPTVVLPEPYCDPTPLEIGSRNRDLGTRKGGVGGRKSDPPKPRATEVTEADAAALDALVAAWNSACAPLPTLRKRPKDGEVVRAMLKAWAWLDGDIEAFEVATRRAAADRYYREHRYGIVQVCRHIAERWDGPEAPAHAEMAVEALGRAYKARRDQERTQEAKQLVERARRPLELGGGLSLDQLLGAHPDLAVEIRSVWAGDSVPQPVQGGGSP